jgi:hypothetical protein
MLMSSSDPRSSSARAKVAVAGLRTLGCCDTAPALQSALVHARSAMQSYYGRRRLQSLPLRLRRALPVPACALLLLQLSRPLAPPHPPCAGASRSTRWIRRRRCG